MTPFAGIRARDPVRLGGGESLEKTLAPPTPSSCRSGTLRGGAAPLGCPGKAHGAPLGLCRVRWGRGWRGGRPQVSSEGATWEISTPSPKKWDTDPRCWGKGAAVPFFNYYYYYFFFPSAENLARVSALLGAGRLFWGGSWTGQREVGLAKMGG